MRIVYRSLAIALAELRLLSSDLRFLRLFTLLLVPATALVAIHASYAIALPADAQFMFHPANLDLDGGYGERFEYLLLGFTATAMMLEYARTRRPLAFLAGGLFAVILADNMLRIHERGGWHLARAVDWLTVDQGQFVVFTLLGLASAAVLLPFLTRSDNIDGRSIALLLLVVPLAGFGVALDAVHAWLGNSLGLDGMLVVLEDGGEMFTACLIAAAAATFVDPESAGEAAVTRPISPGSRPAASDPARSTRTVL